MLWYVVYLCGIYTSYPILFKMVENVRIKYSLILMRSVSDHGPVLMRKFSMMTSLPRAPGQCTYLFIPVYALKLPFFSYESCQGAVIGTGSLTCSGAHSCKNNRGNSIEGSSVFCSGVEACKGLSESDDQGVYGKETVRCGMSMYAQVYMMTSFCTQTAMNRARIRTFLKVSKTRLYIAKVKDHAPIHKSMSTLAMGIVN